MKQRFSVAGGIHVLNVVDNSEQMASPQPPGLMYLGAGGKCSCVPVFRIINASVDVTNARVGSRIKLWI